MRSIFYPLVFAFSLFPVLAQEGQSIVPALFDDFSYTNARFPVDGDSSNSLFGRNIWQTREGPISSRAWRRYNWGDPDNFGPNSILEPVTEGIRLGVARGFRVGDIAPMIGSSFMLKEGVFAARIRFGTLEAGRKLIQAFWFVSPDFYTFPEDENKTAYFSEIDFEWNNWFRSPGSNVMSVGAISAHSKKGLVNRGAILDCIHIRNRSMTFFSECRGEVDGRDIIPGRWYICKLVVDSSRKRISFSMLSDDESSIFAGSRSNEVYPGEEFILDTHYPKYEMAAVFNIGPSRWREDVEETIGADCIMDIDWFYYSPVNALGFRDIKEEVGKLRSKNIPRFNTTDRELFVAPPPNDRHSAHINGPDSLPASGYGHWEIAPDRTGTTYEIRARYRYHAGNGTGEWIPLLTPDFTIGADESHTGIEIEARVKNFWNNYEISVNRVIPVYR